MNAVSFNESIDIKNKKKQIEEEKTNTANEDTEQFSILKTIKSLNRKSLVNTSNRKSFINNSKKSIARNGSNEFNYNKNVRKDAKGNTIQKKDSTNKILKHHAYFVDDINKKLNLVKIIKVETYKEYNKNLVYNSIFEENYRMQIVQNECCCNII